MTYAIVEIQGKQFRVKPGDQLTVDRMDSAVGDVVPIEKVLLVVDGDKTSVGTPSVEGISLSAKILSHGRGEKIRVAKYKSKSKYRKVQGHRQDQTTLEIVTKAAKALPKKEAKPSSKAKTEKKAA